MTDGLSRRAFCGLLGAGLAWPLVSKRAVAAARPFRVRTITAGVPLERAADLSPVQGALEWLARARAEFEAEGWEVQTVRIATPPLAQYLPDWASSAGEKALVELDRLCSEGGASLSLGPVITGDRYDAAFAPFAARLVQATSEANFSVFAASASGGVQHQAIRAAAEATAALAEALPNGVGTFRFAATAFCPPGTPFFPAAHHAGEAAFSIGLESPPLLQQVFEEVGGIPAAAEPLRQRMNAVLGEIEALATRIAGRAGRRYLGIDTSPAPGLDASIGRAIETLTGAPFGSASTLSACAMITGVLQSLDVRICGYSGLMLPVLEDPVLAQRAAEGRYGVPELLLYSSVCGTGLDVVPLPGDTPVDTLAAIITDMASLALRYKKALSARLFPVPGKGAGEEVRFDAPWLTPSLVIALP